MYLDSQGELVADDFSELLPVHCVIDKGLSLHQVSEVLAHDHLPLHPLHLNQSRDQHIWPEDVIPCHFGANDATSDLAHIDPDFDVNFAQEWVFEAETLLIDDLCHLDSNLKDGVGFLDGVF